MGNCHGQQEQALVSKKVTACKPSSVSSGDYHHEQPAKRTYRDFHWFITMLAMSPQGKQFRKTTPDGKKVIKASVNDVSAFVNKFDGMKDKQARHYENYCHLPEWRATLRQYLKTEGINLKFDYEPHNLIEADVHERMGLFKKGYKFTVSFCAPCAPGDVNFAVSTTAGSISTCNTRLSATNSSHDSIVYIRSNFPSGRYSQ